MSSSLVNPAIRTQSASSFDSVLEDDEFVCCDCARDCARDCVRCGFVRCDCPLGDGGFVRCDCLGDLLEDDCLVDDGFACVGLDPRGSILSFSSQNIFCLQHASTFLS